MRKLIEYFIRYPIWANAIIALVIITGLFSLFAIKKSFFPEVDPNLIVVQVVYPGASPEEMEEGVVLKVEEAIKGLQGVEQITSVASENIAVINVEVDADYDDEVVLSDVKNAIDKINSFPENAEKPTVFNQKPTSRAIALLLTGDLDLMTLKRYAEGIRDDLLAAGFISQVDISGFPEKEISIEIPEETLLRYGLSFDQISNAIRLNNRDISSGTIKSSSEEILIRSRAKQITADGIGEIIVRTNPDGSILKLREIAQLREQFAEVPNKITYNGQNAVAITTTKLPEEDVLEITDYVKVYISKFNDANKSVQLLITRDESKFLWQRINLLVKNGMIGLVLVLVLLGMFLSLRLSAWVAFGIPFSFLGMLVIATMMGVTINMISLFGMILVVGILVDDGIVVAENIFHHYEKGKSPLQACVDGTLEVLPAVFTSVLTTIIAFSVFFFIEGRIGQIIFEMAIVVILSLLFSLVECTIILPAHLANSGALDRKADEHKGAVREFLDAFLKFLRDRIYGPSLLLALRYKYVAMTIPVFLFLFISGLMKGGILQTTFFPFIDGDDIDVSLVLKPGTREMETERFLKTIEDKVWEANDELKKQRKDGKDVVLSTRMYLGSAGSGGGAHTGQINVELLPGEERDLPSFVVANAIREKTGPMPEAEEFNIGGRRVFGKPISMSLKSRNLEELEGAKEFVKKELRQMSELKDISDSNIPGRREINLSLKPLAYVLGLTHNDITRQIRQGFFGEEVQRLQIGRDEVKIWLRYPPENRKSLGEMERIRIKTTDGRDFPLTDLVDYDTKRGVVNINHLNGARENRIEADLVDQDQAVDPIIDELTEQLLPAVKAKYPGVLVSFEGQQRSSNQFSDSVSFAGPVALLMIIILISLTFRSFSQAILILLMIPLGISGAILGHWIEGQNLSILSTYGIVALCGVIVNDAVVFTAKYNSLLKEGHTVASAIYYAGKNRFRPIILTSLTTVAGLYPIILEPSRQAQFLVPMAISIAYGVLIGTFFILTLYPALLAVFNDLRVGLNWLLNAGWDWDFRLPDRRDVEPAVDEEKRLEKLM